MRILLAIVLATAAPAVKPTAADTKAAQKTLITAADLGKPWSGKTSAQAGVQLSCKGHQPSGAGIVETGVATSQTLSPAATGPFLLQNTSVFATAAQANAYWKRAVDAGLADCVAQTVEGLGAKGVKVTILSKGKLPLSTSLAHTAAYRVKAKANKLTLYYDVLLLGDGRTITSIAISEFQAPVAAAVEQGLANLVIKKLGGPSA